MNPHTSSPFGSSESQRPTYMQLPSLGGSTFSVAGMAGSSGTQLSSSTWGATTQGSGFGSSLSDPLLQTRPHYTQGYLMSLSQNVSPQQNSQRHDEPPLVQTRAKVNNSLSRSSALDFGKESMFQSSRQRPAFADEDAPPTTSVNDIVDDFHTSTRTSTTFSQSVLRESTIRTPTRSVQPTASHPTSQSLYVIVFGYPPDKYSVTAEYFRSLGDATEPDPNADVTNCFRIGYRDPSAAMRAVRKNGEILGGSWMIGAKWADPAEAESIFGSSASRSSAITPLASRAPDFAAGEAMDEDEVATPGAGALVPATVTVGTPLKLAPSAAAFRKPGTSPAVASVATMPGGNPLAPTANNSGVQQSGKGVFGQVSDLIFGW